MEIKAYSYSTNIAVYRLNNLSYGIGILSALILSGYHLIIEKGNKNKAISNNWQNIKNNFKINLNRIELDN